MAIACPDSATGLLHNRPMPVRPLPRLSLRAALAAGLMSLATIALAQAVAEDPAAAAAANPAAPADHHAYATGDAWIDGRTHVPKLFPENVVVPVLSSAL